MYEFVTAKGDDQTQYGYRCLSGDLLVGSTDALTQNDYGRNGGDLVSGAYSLPTRNACYTVHG